MIAAEAASLTRRRETGVCARHFINPHHLTGQAAYLMLLISNSREWFPKVTAAA